MPNAVFHTAVWTKLKPAVLRPKSNKRRASVKEERSERTTRVSSCPKRYRDQILRRRQTVIKRIYFPQLLSISNFIIMIHIFFLPSHA